MIKNYTYLDVNINKKIHKPIDAIQGDSNSRYVAISLYDSSKLFDLTECTVKVYGIKPDKHQIFNDATITDAKNGKFEIQLTSQALAVVGELEMQLIVLGANQERLSTNSFIVRVHKSLVSGEAIESTNEFTALTEGLANLAEYDVYRNQISKHEVDIKNTNRELMNIGSELEHIKKKKSLKINLVSEFGADPTGVNDSSEQIQSAINSINNENGATITFPSYSKFKITKTINIVNKHNIVFEPTGSGYLCGTFKGETPNLTLFNIQSHGITFSKTRLEGDTSMTGIILGDGVDITFDEFKFTNDSCCYGLGNGIITKMRNYSIRDSLFINCDIGIYIQGYEDIYQNQDIHIYNTRFHNIKNHGIYCNTYIKDSSIINNKIDDSKNGITLTNGVDTSMISNNIISRCSNDGISVNQLQGGKVGLHITNNIITGIGSNDTGDGILFNGSKSKIINNTILDKGKNGINCSKSDYVQIQGNTIESCSHSSSEFYGIHIGSGSQNILKENICRKVKTQMKYGISLNDESTFNILRDNICEGEKGGVNLGSSNSRGEIATSSELPRIVYSDTLPSQGNFRPGDEIRKRNPVIVGENPNKYISLGWKRLTHGVNNTVNVDWVEMRVNVGNI